MHYHLRPLLLLSILSMQLCIGQTLAIENDDELVPLEYSSATPSQDSVQVSQEMLEEPTKISTSRPSVTDTSTTVPKGSLQFENGATYTQNHNNTSSWTLPETLIRLGLSKNTELRFTTPNLTSIQNPAPNNDINNLSDISIGLSHHFVAPGQIDVALIPILNIPTGGNSVSSNSVDPEFRLAWSKTINPKLTAAGQLGSRWNTGQNASANMLITPTVVAYYSFNNKLTGFLEYAAFVPTSGTTSHFIQSGLIYVVKQRHQFDVRIAHGLNENSPSFLVGFGYSFRIDHLFK